MVSTTSHSSTSFMALLFAIDFIEKSQNIKSKYTPKMRTIYSHNNKHSIEKNINNYKSFQGVNRINRSLHFIGQPQWRGYSH